MITGRIMAYLLRQRGWLPLHASAIRLQDRAILFIGPSGVGKSTTAAAFAGSGYTVLSDDIAPVRIADDGCLLQAARPRLKLFADSVPVLGELAASASFQIDKYCFDLDRSELAPLTQVSAIYLMEYGDTVAATTVRAFEAVKALSENTMFSRRRASADLAATHLLACAGIAQVVPVFRLTRPRSLAALPEVVRFIECSNVSKSG